MFITILTGFVFIAEGTSFDDHVIAFADRADHFAGRAAVDIVVRRKYLGCFFGLLIFFFQYFLFGKLEKLYSLLVVLT
jgi:hypothetical protein